MTVDHQAFDQTANRVGRDGTAFRAAGQLIRYPTESFLHGTQAEQEK